MPPFTSVKKVHTSLAPAHGFTALLWWNSLLKNCTALVEFHHIIYLAPDLQQSVSSLLLTTQLINTKSRCHVAVHNVATKWQMMTNVVVHHCCLFLMPWWVPPIPCLSQPTLLRQRTMTNRHRQHQAKVSQGRSANTQQGQQGHSMMTTWQWGVTTMQGNKVMMVHGNNRQWQCNQEMTTTHNN